MKSVGLLLLLVFATAQAASLSVRQIQDTIQLVQSAIAAMDSASEIGSSDLSTNLAPVIALVDGMMDQLSHDTAAHLDNLRAEQSTNQAKAQALQAVVEDMRHTLGNKRAQQSTLEEQRKQASDKIAGLVTSLHDLRAAIQVHSDSCKSKIPVLSNKQARVERDLTLLEALAKRLDEMVEKDGLGGTNVLAEVASSLQAFESPAASQMLLELDAGFDDSEMASDNALIETSKSTLDSIERMKRMVSKLTTELSLSLNNAKIEISTINSTCDNQEKDLVSSRDAAEKEFTTQQNLAGARADEIAALQDQMRDLEAQLDVNEGLLSDLEALIKDEIRSDMTLVQSRQHAMLILSQMKNVLVKFKDSLATAQLPLLVAASNHH